MGPRVVTRDGPVLLPAEGPRRVCLVVLSGIDDAVHGLLLALDLKRLDPAVHVTWVAEPAPAQVLAHHPAVDRVVVYRPQDGARGLWRLARAMSGNEAHLTLNLQRYLKSAWPSLLSGARVRVGLPPSKTRDGIRWIHTHELADGPWKHTQDLFLDFRWALGIPRDAPVAWDLRLSSQEEGERRAWNGALGDRPVAALVVASANPKKDWAPDRYAELADALDHDLGFRVILVGGPPPRERDVVACILRTACARPVDALGVPVVGLFGHTNPWRVGPWWEFRDLVVDRYTEPGAAPDPMAYLPRDGRMEAIPVADVLEKVELARCRYL